MKKLLVSLLLCFSLLAAQSAMVIFRWTPNYNLKVNGMPPVTIKIYYGGEQGHYTNSVRRPLFTVTTNTTYRGYDQYNCVWGDSVNYVNIPIYGLQLSQQVFSAYSVINERGEESPFINESKCGYTVTNKANGPLPSGNLRTTK
jgi:hypothetical protein